jgi:hypothetical protein
VLDAWFRARSRGSDGNVGAILDGAPSLVESLESLRKSVENTQQQS